MSRDVSTFTSKKETRQKKYVLCSFVKSPTPPDYARSPTLCSFAHDKVRPPYKSHCFKNTLKLVWGHGSREGMFKIG